MTLTTSYRTLNQIFYHVHNKFDVPESIYILEEFIYKSNATTLIPTKQNQNQNQNQNQSQQPKVLQQEINSVGIPPSPIKPLQKKSFVPFFTDTIFWSVFYHVYGEQEYAMITSKHGNRMLEEKKKIMEYFQKSPKTLKQSTTKFTNDRIQETMSEFMCTKNCSSFLETAAYALYYNLSIIIIDEKKRTYLIFKDKETPSDNICILNVNRNKNGHDDKQTDRVGIQEKKRYELLLSVDFNISILDSYVCLEQFDKPLKAMTHYKKISELHEIADKLGVHMEPKMKKQDIYNLLAQKMAW